MSPTLLACFHTVELHVPPRFGDILWCVRCQSYQPVSGTHEHWTARCTQCAYRQGFGASGGDARRGAAKHAARRRHVVVLKVNGVERERLAVEGEPFARFPWMAEHQASLRSLPKRDPT